MAAQLFRNQCLGPTDLFWILRDWGTGGTLAVSLTALGWWLKVIKIDIWQVGGHLSHTQLVCDHISNQTSAYQVWIAII